MKMLALGVALGVLIALGGAVFAHREAPTPAAAKAIVAPTPRTPLSAADSAQISEVLERVQREYVDKIEGPKLIDDALRGMVGRLDPYSSFLDAEEYADLRVSTAGTYAGIGIEVGRIGIEARHHAAQRVIDELGIAHVVDVLALYALEYLGYLCGLRGRQRRPGTGHRGGGDGRVGDRLTLGEHGAAKCDQHTERDPEGKQLHGAKSYPMSPASE